MADTRTIHLVDDEEAIRRATGFLLRTSGFVVQTYTSGVEFLAAAGTAQPGCVLLDIRMPEMDGLEVQQALLDRGIAFPVVVLTGHGDVALAVRAIKAGAVEFIEKPFQKLVLFAAIEEAFLRLADVGRDRVNAADATTKISALTPRERDVFDGMVSGHPNKIIAYNLDISSRTVEVHRASVMGKLKVRSLSQALRIAFAAGLGAEATV